MFKADARAMVHALSLCSDTSSRDGLVKIDAQKGSVTLLSSSGRSGSAIVVADASASKPAVVFVLLRGLASVMQQCEGDVSFSVKNNNLHIVNEPYETKLLLAADPEKTFLYRDYSDQESKYEVDLEELQSVLKLLAPTTSMITADDCRGVVLSSEDKKLRVYSTDAHRSICGYSGTVASSGKGDEPAMVGIDFIRHIQSLKAGDRVSIATGKNAVVVYSDCGLAYFVQMVIKSRPFQSIAKVFSEKSKPAQVVAGILARALKSVTVLSDPEEGCPGRITFAKKELCIETATTGTGASRSRVIIAGELSIANWYNLKVLRDYVSRIDPEAELNLSTIDRNGFQALIIEHASSVYWIISREQPHAEQSS